MMHNTAYPAKVKLGCAVLMPPLRDRASSALLPSTPAFLEPRAEPPRPYRAQNAIDHKSIDAAERCERGLAACGLSSRALLLAHDQSAGQHCSLCTGIGRSAYC